MSQILTDSDLKPNLDKLRPLRFLFDRKDLKIINIVKFEIETMLLKFYVYHKKHNFQRKSNFHCNIK